MVQDGTRTHVEGLGHKAERADSACEVPTLSIGKLCAEDGFRLTWKPFAPSPDILDAAGNPLPVTVENLVPMLKGDGGRKRLAAFPAEGAPVAGTESTQRRCRGILGHRAHGRSRFLGTGRRHVVCHG